MVQASSLINDPNERMNDVLRPNLNRTMQLEGGWRAYEDLPLQLEANGPHFYERHKGFHLDENDDCGCDRQRCGSVQGDAERAVISVGIDGMDVGYLNEREQCKQGQAHQHHHIGCKPRAAGAAHPFIKSGQTLSFL
jgi:hypothetical protein